MIKRIDDDFIYIETENTLILIEDVSVIEPIIDPQIMSENPIKPECFRTCITMKSGYQIKSFIDTDVLNKSFMKVVLGFDYE